MRARSYRALCILGSNVSNIVPGVAVAPRALVEAVEVIVTAAPRPIARDRALTPHTDGVPSRQPSAVQTHPRETHVRGPGALLSQASPGRASAHEVPRRENLTAVLTSRFGTAFWFVPKEFVRLSGRSVTSSRQIMYSLSDYVFIGMSSKPDPLFTAATRVRFYPARRRAVRPLRTARASSACRARTSTFEPSTGRIDRGSPLVTSDTPGASRRHIERPPQPQQGFSRRLSALVVARSPIRSLRRSRDDGAFRRVPVRPDLGVG